MSVKFFGQFLLERGKIIREELLDALKLQKTVNVKLGTIALDAGYLTADQVEKIHYEQQRTDKLFGEIAIAFEFLNTEQLEELLIIQKNERISLGDALIQKGYLTMSSLEEELKAYKAENKGNAEDARKAIGSVKNPEIPEIFLDLSIKLLRRLADLEMEVVDSSNNAEKIAPYIWNAYQRFEGDSNGMYILSVTERPFLKIASSLAQETLREIDDFTKDAVKEFVNTLVGNTAAKLSQQHIKIDLQAPGVFTSLGNINIDASCTEAVTVKLASPEHELQMSVVYSPIIDT